MISRNNKQLNASGFTLVEVMAAIMVLSIGLIGSLTVINFNLRNIFAQEDRITAARMAEEGMELARNIRDTSWLEGAADWKDSLLIGLNKTRLSFFCGGIASVAMGRNVTNTQDWDSTLDAGSGCNGSKCRIYKYKIDGDSDENFICYSDNFGNNPSYYGVNYRLLLPRSEFYRLVTVTRIDDNSVKIESFVKYGVSGDYTYLPVLEETLYNWK